MQTLWQMVREANDSPVPRDFVARVVRELDVPERNPRALAEGIQQWVQRNIRYVREYPEIIASPERTLEWGIGDCDDRTVLVASALRSARIPARAVFVGWKDGPGPVPFKHVYPQACLDGHWVTVETVRPVPLGWDASLAHARKGHRVAVQTIGDDRNLILG